VYGSNAGYRLLSGDIRAPDVSFVRQERLPGGRSPKGFADYPPDLAVEVLSPNQTLEDVEEKIGEFMVWGTPLAWVLDPDARSVKVYRSLMDSYMLGPDEALTGEEIIPGFTVRVGDLLY
jgi:Uma2 family endonuclease